MREKVFKKVLHAINFKYLNTWKKKNWGGDRCMAKTWNESNDGSAMFALLGHAGSACFIHSITNLLHSTPSGLVETY